MTDTATLTRRSGPPQARLRELPPFGEPDDGEPRSIVGGTADIDDPRGVYLPPPEARVPAR